MCKVRLKVAKQIAQENEQAQHCWASQGVSWPRGLFHDSEMTVTYLCLSPHISNALLPPHAQFITLPSCLPEDVRQCEENYLFGLEMLENIKQWFSG